MEVVSQLVAESRGERCGRALLEMAYETAPDGVETSSRLLPHPPESLDGERGQELTNTSVFDDDESIGFA